MPLAPGEVKRTNAAPARFTFSPHSAGAGREERAPCPARGHSLAHAAGGDPTMGTTATEGQAMGEIKNVVFDMGGVLMKYDPEAFARPHVESDEDARLVAEQVFGGREWPLQDAGVVDAETIGWTAAGRLPERLREAAMQTALRWFEQREYFAGADEAIRELKRRGYGIYLLSNAGVQFDQYKESLPAWECFDGVVVSAFVHLMKPDPRIFSLLADNYGLSCDECLFVDDVAVNVEGARRADMHGLVYAGEMADVFEALGEGVPA